MNSDFPRIITFLRKERGLSQKQVSQDLGISQALLSHYEKGIRECSQHYSQICKKNTIHKSLCKGSFYFTLNRSDMLILAATL